MQPPLITSGTRVRNLGEALALMNRIGKQAAANANLEVQGAQVDSGWRGTEIAQPLPVMLQCFEITGSWTTSNCPPNAGASQGQFWACDAKRVVYWWGDYFGGSGEGSGECSGESSGEVLDHSFWQVSAQYETERIFYAVSGPDRTGATAPTATVGDWVWCYFDYQADVWRMITAPAATTRTTAFILRSDLDEGGYALAEKLVYRVSDFPCPYYGSSGENMKSLCFDYPTRTFFYVFDRLGEFTGLANTHGGMAEILSDTPTNDEVCIPDGPPSDDLPGQWDTTLWEIRRIVCPNYLGSPGQTTDLCSSGE